MSNDITATAAPMGTTGWYLVGKRTEGGTCGHCGRALKHLFDVVTSDREELTVGRGCVKKLTGWTLTEAEARRLLWLAERDRKRATTWAAFELAHPEIAATILADVAAYEEGARACRLPRCASGSHEMRDWVADGRSPQWLLDDYLRRRREWSWAR